MIYGTGSSNTIERKTSLSEVLANIEGWTAGRPTPLDPKIIEALDLDDYVSQGFFKGHDRVSLYIGYYFNTHKIGAAHHPLVCFSGQGWMVSERQNGKLMLGSNPEYCISYSSMRTQRGLQSELIIYWFQSYDETSLDTLTQKIKSLWIAFICGRKDNAFVRISIPLSDKSLSEARETGFQFVRAFYPVFMDYVKGS